MIYINRSHLDKTYFANEIRRAMDQIMFCGAEAELLGEILYDQLYAYVILQIMTNIDTIHNDLQHGETYNKIHNMEYRLNSEINQLKSQINSLESQITLLQHDINKLSK